MRLGLVMNPLEPEYFPPPLLLSWNRAAPDSEYTVRIALKFVLVASTSSRHPGGRGWQRARWIRTVSAAAGAPGLTVSVVERVLPNHVAVIVTDVCAVTELVVTAKVLLDAPLLTTTSEGTDATAGSLLLSWTPAPSFMGPLNVTVPVTPLPPVVLVGLTETDDSVGPAGGAGLTERLAVRGGSRPTP
jgi:hypothetical protein